MKILVPLLLSFSFFSASFAVAAGPVVTVDRLTCKQAQQYVRRFGMYWKTTQFDGPIPITFIKPSDDSNICDQGDVPEAHRERTRDDSWCLVGFRCWAG
jgi:hypothetical protein